MGHMRIIPNPNEPDEPELPELGENEIFKYLVPVTKQINDCEKFSISLQDEIECLKEKLKACKESKFYFFRAFEKLCEGKISRDWYDPNNVECITARKIQQAMEYVNLDIKDIEKVIEEKVKQYKTEEQKSSDKKMDTVNSSTIYKQDMLSVKEQEFHDLLLKLYERAYIDKLSVNRCKDILNDNFSGNLLDCSNDIKNKINWRKTWCALKYTCELMGKYNIIVTEKTDKAFIAAHFLFHDDLKSAEQVKNGYEHCKLKEQDKKILDEIFNRLFGKYL